VKAGDTTPHAAERTFCARRDGNAIGSLRPDEFETSGGAGQRLRATLIKRKMTDEGNGDGFHPALPSRYSPRTALLALSARRSLT